MDHLSNTDTDMHAMGCCLIFLLCQPSTGRIDYERVSNELADDNVKLTITRCYLDRKKEFSRVEVRRKGSIPTVHIYINKETKHVASGRLFLKAIRWIGRSLPGIIAKNERARFELKVVASIYVRV